MNKLKLIMIAAVVLIIGTVSGCQFLQKDRASSSDCSLTCKDCKGLQMDCDLNTTRQNRYTQGRQPDDVETESEVNDEKTSR
jgi:hypothetical protein